MRLDDHVNIDCRSCKFWDQRFPQNTDLGVCRKLGALRWEEQISLVLSEDDGHPATDFEAVRTRAEFGCVKHTRPGELLSWRDTARVRQGSLG